MFGSKVAAHIPHITRHTRYESRPSRYEKQRSASDQRLHFALQFGVLVAISLTVGVILAILY